MEKELKEEIIEELRDKGIMSEIEIKDFIIDKVIDKSREIELDIGSKNELIKNIFNSICRYDLLQIMLDNKEIDEIMVNGPNTIFYEMKGKIYKEERTFENIEQLENIIQTIVGKMNRMVNQANPIVDVRLGDGSRVNVVLKPVAIDGPILTIRKFNKDFLDMKDLLLKESINKEVIDLLKVLVRYKYNIFISGGASSGKTTFLNLLAGFIPKDERIVTIEDSAELAIRNLENIVRLEARQLNQESIDSNIDIRSLIKTALRMRPDRIIVGEVRGHEAFDMLTAMNTGHEGSMSTGHANSAKDMLLRLLTMVIVGNNLKEEVGINLIKTGIDIIVHLQRQKVGRKVIGVYEIEKEEEGLVLNTLFERNSSGKLTRKNNIKYLEKLNVYSEN
ncbi:MAG: ATPase, T2SS/T4P/T4SS family [Firmicutes bacterium]|nr:ATPase, T2SS/T4P/T4SS family [Bacillota bacterium]